MKEIEIHFDRGHGDKTLTISPQKIAEETDDHDLLEIHKPGLVIFAVNGKYAPPFHQGSKVLKALRASTGLKLDQWKLVIPLSESDQSLIRIFDDMPADFEAECRSFWGIWHCRSENREHIPDLLAANFPVWELRNQWAKRGEDTDFVLDKLSGLYRAIVAGIDATRTFSLSPFGAVVMADLGGGMLDGKKSNARLQPLRIRVLGEVLGAWLSNSVDPSHAIVSFGGTLNDEILAQAWGEHAAQSKDEEAEFGHAQELRKENAEWCKRLAALPKFQSGNSGVAGLLQQASDTFGSVGIALGPDMLQSRAVAEALAAQLAILFDAKQGDANLFAYTTRLEETKKVSPWITSYLHVLRQLGNEAAHFKATAVRRPEHPVGRDLVVIHAALNRLLSFAHGEFSRPS
jgi:hypothetical protein